MPAADVLAGLSWAAVCRSPDRHAGAPAVVVLEAIALTGNTGRTMTRPVMSHPKGATRWN